MRNLSKCKLFLCVRPVVDIDVMLESKVSNKHGTKKSEAKSVFFQQGSTKFSKSWIMKLPTKKTLSRAIKAVVFDTILNRRAHPKNRYLHDSFGSKHSYGSEAKALQPPLSSSSSNGSTSSYSSSPMASESENVSKCHPAKQQKKEISHGGPLGKQNKFECYGIYLVLISLVFTVFWGKLFGIILTSMLLYFSSLWNSSYCCQKSLPSYPRATKAKSRCHYGRSYEVCSKVNYHNEH